MIDIDHIDMKMLPSDHIVLKDYEYIVGLEKKNKMLNNTIVTVIGLIVIVVVIVTYKILKDEKRDQK